MNSELLCFNGKTELRLSSKAFGYLLFKSTQRKHFDYFAFRVYSHFASNTYNVKR